MTRRRPKTSPLGRLLELGSLAVRAGASTAATHLSTALRSAPVREARRTEELVRNAHRLVATLGELKGAAMKVGQMLSLQDAFLPPEVAAVLRALQKETPSLPLEMVEEQLAEELGDPLQLFASFEPEAFAAASIGQVHRAVLRDGRRVAVKVQYPGIDRIVEADLGNLRFSVGIIVGKPRFPRDYKAAVLQGIPGPVPVDFKHDTAQPVIQQVALRRKGDRRTFRRKGMPDAAGTSE